MYLLAVLLLLGATGTSCAFGDMYVYYLDVGQAEATLLRGPDFTILIDAGDRGKTDVIEHLHRLNVVTIDLFIITHPHADHIGQAAQVLETFQVAEVWMSGFEHYTMLYEAVLDALLANGVDYWEPRAGKNFDFGDLKLETINPTEVGSNLHASNIVVRAVYGDTALLFTGDAERRTERDILGTDLQLQAQVLSLGHHGSQTSSSLDFLLAIRPEVAVYSAGLGNPFSHPHEEVINRLIILGIPVYGTDRNGTIVVWADGVGYRIYSESGQPLIITDFMSIDHPGLNGVELNTASLKDLQRIIHIGPERASEIMELRQIVPFRSLDDLKWVFGLGAQKIEEIKEQGVAYVKGVMED